MTPQGSTPNVRSGTDPNRGEVIGKGIYHQLVEPLAVQTGSRGGSGHDLQTRVMATTFAFSVDIVKWPDAKYVRQGDLLTLDDARKFIISSVKPDGLSRVDWELTAPAIG